MNKDRFFEIADKVAERTSVRVDDIFSRKRIEPIADARHLFFYIVHKENFTHSYINMFMADRGFQLHHSSITHGIEKATTMVEKRKEMQEIVDKICAD